ncbi:hypothetical protein HPG69_014763 [Diceros bicornis minor]|uniref:Uncharacterized protein n=1 Tax=Diceros bicornis minor TaxID=77932 RepID=A0A7J7EID4_DICBM|nr:hypothetical protein HPG69_014763 [Diceros bicornis minor]
MNAKVENREGNNEPPKVAQVRSTAFSAGDTNLCKMLLIVLILPDVPSTGTQKNNALAVCVVNPPINEKNATISKC